MKLIFEKPIRIYVLGMLILSVVTALILMRTGADLYILFPVLITQFVVQVIMLLHIADRFIRPLDKVIGTVGKLVEGNFRARIQHPALGKMGELNEKINALARNLSELSIHEQMQSEQLATIVNNIESGLVLIDEKGYIHYVNRTFLSMFGKDSKSYHGYLYYDVLENEEIHRAVQETFLYEKNIKALFTKKSGMSDKYFEIVGAPIFDDRKHLKGAVLVLYDITELKKLEIMRKDFVANVSHELKTPITSLRGFAETLLDGAMDDPEALRQFLDIMYEEGSRLQYLIDDLLTLSKLENEGFQMRISKTNLAELVREAEPFIRHKAENKQIHFDYTVDPGLEAAIDRERIKQVIINLTDNAISYTPEKGSVTLEVGHSGSHLLITVKDTGIGIAQSDVPRLFERFYRVDKARSRNTGGTGLGLAIVKHIVELHQGEISLESELGKGSVFTIRLPQQQACT